MTFRFRAHSLAALFSLLAPAASAQAPAEVPSDQARAQAAMADLGQRLKGALVAKMQAEGPVAAVDFCHVQAPVIAQSVAEEHGVGIGRTALRLRSLANAPAPWQAPVLEEFLEKSHAGTPVGQLVYIAREDGRLRVAKGIGTEAPCLVCHGQKIAEPIRAAISERYPDDAATGFSEGDLRGMFWVEVPPETDAPAVREDDARVAIFLNDAERDSLRAEMRWRMELLSRVTSALALGNWQEAADAGRLGANGTPRGVDFRPAMPEGWFAMSRPMVGRFAQLAEEAGHAQRLDVALKSVAEASSYCVACHAAYRIQSGQ